MRLVDGVYERRSLVMPDQHVCQSGRNSIRLKIGEGGVALAVQIDEEDFITPDRQAGGKVTGGRCFTDTALLIRYGNGSHAALSLTFRAKTSAWLTSFTRLSTG